MKSVLRVAGGMKRANPGLMIPNHDIPIFLRLINDLFMGLTVDSKVDLEEFYLSIREFRNVFRMNVPFKFNGDCSDAYKLLDSYALKLDDLDIKIQRFHELEEFFELQQTNYPEIGETRTEMKQLKSLWDFKAMVSLIYLSWRALLWKNVDTEDLEEQNKQIRKQVKERGNFFPVIKGWQVYRDIDDVMTVMSIVLPLVNDLHLDAMKSRHWSSLARVCNIKISILHNCA